jgi:hypothetical protein
MLFAAGQRIHKVGTPDAPFKVLLYPHARLFESMGAEFALETITSKPPVCSPTLLPWKKIGWKCVLCSQLKHFFNNAM